LVLSRKAAVVVYILLADPRSDRRSSLGTGHVQLVESDRLTHELELEPKVLVVGRRKEPGWATDLSYAAASAISSGTWMKNARRRHAMSTYQRKVMAMCLVASLGIGLDDATAQDKAKDPPKLGWSNSTDLSLVLTAGNSAAQTWGFSDQLRHEWIDARFEFEANVVRSNTSDDRFFLVAPGLEFPAGGAPVNPPTSLVKPDPTLDVATYLLRGRYERNITRGFFWNTGASWDRNDDAGILNRYIVHAGIGNKWVDRERRRFATSYGISYTDREEEEPDPEKDRRFAGARLGWDYMEQFNVGTTFDHKFAANVNLSDPPDYSIDTTSALTVSVVSHVSLKVSLQWLYEHEPALEPDLDVIAYVEVINPDGVPGSGDERFRTLSSSESKLVIGTADARKDKLDTIVRTALVIRF
jgi:hypothetical protein